jgi:hypothetical protein
VALGVEDASESVLCEPRLFSVEAVESEESPVSSASIAVGFVLLECEVFVSSSEEPASADFVFVDVCEDSTVSDVSSLASLTDDFGLVLLDESASEEVAKVDASFADLFVFGSVLVSSPSLSRDLVLVVLATADSRAADPEFEDFVSVDTCVVDFRVCDSSLMFSVSEVLVLVVDDTDVNDLEMSDFGTAAVSSEDACSDDFEVPFVVSSFVKVFAAFSSDVEAATFELAETLSLFGPSMFSASLNSRQKLATSSL